MIDLTAIKPHVVSRDLSGYITYVYGAPKVGKTTLASQMPKPLLLAFERGYNALPGVVAQEASVLVEDVPVERPCLVEVVYLVLDAFAHLLCRRVVDVPGA